jgi:hypothetical protein
MNNEMTRPWGEIQHWYANTKMPEMAALVDSVVASSYASGLFAWTSMWNLNIAQTPVEHPYTGPHLSIMPLGNGRVELRYVDTRRWDEQWHRTVTYADAFARLERFFKELNWFTQY